MEKSKSIGLCEMQDTLRRYAPGVELLDYIKRPCEHIVIYRDDSNACTPYIIHHLASSGLYYGRYYADARLARVDFADMM